MVKVGLWALFRFRLLASGQLSFHRLTDELCAPVFTSNSVNALGNPIR